MGIILRGVWGMEQDQVSGAGVTRSYWQYVVFAVVCVVCLLPTLFHVLTHPALLRRRLRFGLLAEPEPRQKLIYVFLMLGLWTLAVVLVLDSRNGWSSIPVYLIPIGDLLDAAGLILVWLVFRANPFAGATVTVETEQTVISTGPYAHIRHPFYSGLLLVFLGAPVALGSWWGLVLFPALLSIFIWRLRDEESYLAEHLPGYQDYCNKVTHRLIPLIW